MHKRKFFFESERFDFPHDYENPKSNNNISAKMQKKMSKTKNYFDDHEKLSGGNNISIENRNDQTFGIKKNKSQSYTSTGNSFDASFATFDLINNRNFKVFNETHKNKPPYKEVNGESIALQQGTDDKSCNEPARKVKKRHKSKSSSIDDEILELEQKPVKDHIIEEKRKHTNKYSALVNEGVVQHNAVEESAKEEHLKKKKKRHKNKISSKEFGDQNFVPQLIVNVDDVWKEHIKEKEEKRKNKHSAKDVMVHHNAIEESVEEEHIKEKKKKHKNKISFKEDGDSNFTSLDLINEYLINNKSLVLHNTIEESAKEEHIKEKKKKHKNKHSTKESEGFMVLHNTIEESVEEEHIKEKKKKHKEFSDENIVFQHAINVESANVEPLKKKRKNHKCNLSPKNAEVQHNTIRESLKEKISHNSNSASVVVLDDDNLAVHTINVEDEDQGPIKKKHKNNSMNVGGEIIKIAHNADVESEKVEHVKEKKKHKHKSTSLERNDEPIMLQENIQVESVDEKSRKKIHKSKYKEIEDESPVVQHNISKESENEHVKKKNKNHQYHKNSNKDRRMESNSMFSSSDEELYNSIGTPVQLIAQYLDFTEEPIKFEVPLLHSSEIVQQISKEEQEDLKSKGVSIKFGKFSEKENSLLKRNYEEFVRRFGVNDPSVLLGLGQKYRKKELVQFLKAKHFYVRLGKDLNDRPLYNIYKKAREMFDGKGEKLSSSKVVKMKKTHHLIGNKWTNIGSVIHRGANTTRSAFYWYDKPVNIGKWTTEEDSQLIKAIMDVWDVTDLCEIDLKGKWEEVAELVPTRNFHQCRLHWFENLSCRYKKTLWSKKDYAKLISILSRECYVEDYTLINWEEVEKCFRGPGWQFLRKKLFALKKRLKHKNMTYKQMLDYFYAKYNPELLIENSDSDSA